MLVSKELFLTRNQNKKSPFILCKWLVNLGWCQEQKTISTIRVSIFTKIVQKDTVETNRKSKRIQCEYCEKKFNKQATFKIHMKSVHENQVSSQKEINLSQNNEINETNNSRNSRFNSKLSKSQSKLTFQDNSRILRSYKKPSSAQNPNN